MLSKKVKWFSCSYCGDEFKSLSNKKYCESCISKRFKRPIPKSSTTMRMIRNREFVKNYKKDKKCGICGYNRYPEILEFHHRDKKEKAQTINTLMKTLRSIEIIKKEIEKCDIICSNCHKELHLMEKYSNNEK